MELAYSGEAYNGWQRQPNAPSVQAALEERLSKLLGTPTEIVGAGRTDTGVHASHYVAHFDSPREITKPADFCYHLNAMLPADIAVSTVYRVNPSAHARFDALAREYHYHIILGKDPFRRRNSWQYHGTLNVEEMNRAAECLLTERDFTSFAKLNSNNHTNICRVMTAQWERVGERELMFRIRADRFLRNMVRAIVGTLVDVGRGKITAKRFGEIVRARNLSLSSSSAPAAGLHLADVEYPETIKKLKDTTMLQKIKTEFESRFGGDYRVYASSGRVNLIGEHTDYNLGFVLPGAIDKAIYVAIRPIEGEVSKLYSVDYDVQLDWALSGEAKPAEQWACYPYGIVQEMAKRGGKVGAFEVVFGGDVPLGAGLSSSAALESAFGFALNEEYGLGFSREELAKIGQMTEHNYIGVRCGIMDQFASLMGREGKLIRLDCRSLEYTLVPFNPVGCRVVLVDSMVKHSLASSEYNVRREQCEKGVAIVAAHEEGVESLRDVSKEMLDKYKAEMDEMTYRRCAYVIDENQRLMDACDALEKGDYEEFGRKIFGSHDGLSKEYGVSCKELDFIAEIARSTEGVLGARMMGGGFGGCVIHLLKAEAYDGYIATVKEKFAAEFGVEPRVIDVVIGDGARRIE